MSCENSLGIGSSPDGEFLEETRVSFRRFPGYISKNIKPNKVLSGEPATDIKTAILCRALVRRLPELFEQVKQLEKRVGDLSEGTT